MYTFGLWKTIPDSAVYWDNFSRNSFNIVEVHRIVVYSLALLPLQYPLREPEKDARISGVIFDVLGGYV